MVEAAVRERVRQRADFACELGVIEQLLTQQTILMEEQQELLEEQRRLMQLLLAGKE